jgi:hypothetical protein
MPPDYPDQSLVALPLRWRELATLGMSSESLNTIFRKRLPEDEVQGGILWPIGKRCLDLGKPIPRSKRMFALPIDLRLLSHC